jgi:hypothetical protein
VIEPTFSERRGLRPLKKPFQFKTMNKDLRTGLWNGILRYYLRGSGWLEDNYETQQLFIRAYMHLYNLPVDEMPKYLPDLKQKVKYRILNSEWNDVYDFLEFLPNNYLNDEGINQQFIDYCNSILERENAGYRFIGMKIADITSDIV